MVQTSRPEVILTSLLDYMFAVAVRLTRCEADAEDLVQETCLRTLQVLKHRALDGNIRAYLNKVMINVYINVYRHRQVVLRTNELVHLGSLDGTFYCTDCQLIWADPETRFRHSNLSNEVAHALDRLPLRFREVLIMADVMDFSYAEIAKMLNVPIGTVMSRLFRARHAMRARLSGRMTTGHLEASSCRK